MTDCPLYPAQFAWACCDAGDFPPPIPKRGDRYGKDAVCCLCGGPTHGVGWPRAIGIADTFTDVANMACLASQTVCQACVATSKTEGWQQYVRAHPERGLPASFPQKESKQMRGWNWLYSHHLFVAQNHHACPKREQWRDTLINPPSPPFLAIYAVSGKKQILFKGRIAQSRDAFFIQMDDASVLIRPHEFKQALTDFDRLYQLGFSKDGILTGHYHNKTLLGVGLQRWREAEAYAAPWRQQQPALWQLCHALTLRPDDWEPPHKAIRTPYSPIDLSVNLTAPPRQQGLF